MWKTKVRVRKYFCNDLLKKTDLWLLQKYWRSLKKLKFWKSLNQKNIFLFQLKPWIRENKSLAKDVKARRS